MICFCFFQGLRGSQSADKSAGRAHDGLHTRRQDHRIFVRAIEEMFERRGSLREENGRCLRCETLRHFRQ